MLIIKKDKSKIKKQIIVECCMHLKFNVCVIMSHLKSCLIWPVLFWTPRVKKRPTGKQRVKLFVKTFVSLSHYLITKTAYYVNTTVEQLIDLALLYKFIHTRYIICIYGESLSIIKVAHLQQERITLKNYINHQVPRTKVYYIVLVKYMFYLDFLRLYGFLILLTFTSCELGG